MDERIRFIVYFSGAILTGAGLANLFADLIIFGISPFQEIFLSDAVIIAVGLAILMAGLHLVKEVAKEASVYSLLMILAVILALFVVKIIRNTEMWTEFLIAAIITAIAGIALHVISNKIGIYEGIKQIYPWNRNNRS